MVQGKRIKRKMKRLLILFLLLSILALSFQKRVIAEPAVPNVLNILMMPGYTDEIRYSWKEWGFGRRFAVLTLWSCDPTGCWVVIRPNQSEPSKVGFWIGADEPYAESQPFPRIEFVSYSPGILVTSMDKRITYRLFIPQLSHIIFK